MGGYEADVGGGEGWKREREKNNEREREKNVEREKEKIKRHIEKVREGEGRRETVSKSSPSTFFYVVNKIMFRINKITKL